jgi:hypothetical protein
MADEMEAWTRQDYGTRLASQQLRKAAITIFALKDKP